MDLPGDQLLARSVLAEDENAGVGARGLADSLAHPLHARASAHHPVLDEQGVAQVPVLLSQILQRERIARHRHGPIERQRLLKEIEGAHLDRLHGKGDVRVARDHDDLDVGVLFAQPLQHVDAAHVGQPHVEEDEVDRAARELGEARDAVLGGEDGVALVLKDIAQHRADARLVVDDENRAHARAPVGRSMKNVVPVLPSLSTQTLPLWSKRILCTMARPSPVPSFFVVK